MKIGNQKIKKQTEDIIRGSSNNPSKKWVRDLINNEGFLNPDHLSQKNLAGIFGITSQALGGWSKKSDCPRHHDKDGIFYKLQEVIGWKLRKSVKVGDALLVGGEGSPALERYRGYRAELARLDVLKREEQLIDRRAIHDLMTLLSTVLRSTGERLGKVYGKDAQQMMNEAIESFRKETNKLKPKAVKKKRNLRK